MGLKLQFMYDTGLIDYMGRKYEKPPVVLDPPTEEKVSMEDMLIIMGVWILGQVVSIVIFVIELLQYRLQKRLTNRVILIGSGKATDNCFF